MLVHIRLLQCERRRSIYSILIGHYILFPTWALSNENDGQWAQQESEQSGGNAEWFSRILKIMLWIINIGEDESAKKEKKKKMYGKIT